MRLWHRPAERNTGAGGDAEETVCAHCDEQISPCRGDLPHWGRDRQLHDCRFGRYVHISGERPGSHLCGTDGQVATPASCPGDAE